MIDGKLIAQKMISELKRLPTPRKKLAAILIGDNKYSRSFLKQKSKTAKELGVKFELHEFSEKLPQKELERKIIKICRRQDIGGVIIQIPVPERYNREAVLAQIDPKKDIDNLTGVTQPILAPAPASLKRILQEVNFELKGKKVVVIGPGFLIGRPIACWLVGKVGKLTVWGRVGFDERALKEADLIVTAAGVPGLVKGKNIKKNAVLIDYGYGTNEKGKVAGDIDIATCRKKTSYFTPTPGGTGPIVVAQLFWNFYHLSR